MSIIDQEKMTCKRWNIFELCKTEVHDRSRTSVNLPSMVVFVVFQSILWGYAKKHALPPGNNDTQSLQWLEVNQLKNQITSKS